MVKPIDSCHDEEPLAPLGAHICLSSKAMSKCNMNKNIKYKLALVKDPFAAEKVLRQKPDACEHLDYRVKAAGCTAVLQAGLATRCSMDVGIGPAFIPGTLACCVNLL